MISAQFYSQGDNAMWFSITNLLSKWTFCCLNWFGME